LIQIQTAAGPPAVLALLCGIRNVTINRSVTLGERQVRDCAAPFAPPQRKIRNNGTTWSISGSGESNVDLQEEYADAFGVKRIYSVPLYKDNETDDLGDLLGTYSGTAMLTTHNETFDQTSDDAGTVEITLEGDGPLVFTPAP
jgi:hypothetical protein